MSTSLFVANPACKTHGENRALAVRLKLGALTLVLAAWGVDITAVKDARYYRDWKRSLNFW